MTLTAGYGEHEPRLSHLLIRSRAGARQLLSAAHPGVALPRATDVPDTTPDDSAQTPETYLGAERTQGYVGRTAYATGPFALPATVRTDAFALGGAWDIGQESVTAGTGAAIRLSFHAADVYLDVGGTGTLTVTTGGERVGHQAR